MRSECVRFLVLNRTGINGLQLASVMVEKLAWDGEILLDRELSSEKSIFPVRVAALGGSFRSR